MAGRVERAMTVISVRSAAKPPIVVGHAGFLRILIAEHLGFRLVREGIRIDNTSITRFDYVDGLATFLRINDTDHLACLPAESDS